MNATRAKSKDERAGAVAPPPTIETIAPSGNLTIYEASSAKDELLQLTAQDGVIALDLTQVAEIDTAGMQLLLLCHRENAKQGKALRISGCSPAVQDLIDLYDLAGVFGMEKASCAPAAAQD